MPVSRLNAAANLLGLLYPASHAAIETCFPCMSASLAKDSLSTRIRSNRHSVHFLEITVKRGCGNTHIRGYVSRIMRLGG